MEVERRKHREEEGGDRHREERRRKHEKHAHRSPKVVNEEKEQGGSSRHRRKHRRHEEKDGRRDTEFEDRREKDGEGRRERHHHKSRRNQEERDEVKENEPKHRGDKRDQRHEDPEEQVGEPKNKRGRREPQENEEKEEPKRKREKKRRREGEDKYYMQEEEEQLDYEGSDTEDHHGGYHHVPDDNRYYGGQRGSGVILKEDVSEDYEVGTRYYAEPTPKRPAREPRNQEKEGDNENKPGEAAEAPKRKTMDTLMTRTGGAYIPPGKLRMMQASITDKSSTEYQRIAWEALKKSVHGHINKVNISNIAIVARLLFKENIVRGRGLLCRSIVQAQAASPTFTNVYACLVAIINSKFPNIGELLLKRVVIRFKRAYKRNDKAVCLSSATFIAHLINQRVSHEILGLELLTLLVESPTDDSVEVAVSFLKEAGQKLGEVSSKGSNAIFDMLRNILHEGKLDKRIQYMIEVMFQVRKDGFQSFPSVTEELDLVDEEDQFTHLITFDDADDPQDILNVFKMDTDYLSNEDKYKALRSEILDTDDDGESGDDGDESGDSDDDSDEDEQTEEQKMTIIDQTETNLVALRKTIYLTIQSSLDFEECAHKLLRMDIKPGQEKELCHMFLDCCAEQRTYEKFFGLLAQRFCQVNQTYVAPFEQIFMDSYNTVHRLDTNKLRNVAKFFGHLLFTDAISWAVFSIIKLNEEDTTSSSRIFIKILFQELAEYKGLTPLNTRLKDPSLQEAMGGLFPRDDPKNTRFAINFFTSIGLGGLTDDLREHLKNIPKPVPISQLIQEVSSASSESSSSSSEESSSEESSSSEEEEKRKTKKNKKKQKEGSNKEKKKGESAPSTSGRDRALPGRSDDAETSSRREQNSRDWKGQRASEEDGDRRGQNSRDWKGQRASEEEGDRRGQSSRDWKGQRATDEDGDWRGQNGRDWKGQRASEQDGGDWRGQNSRDWKGQRASEEDGDRRGQNSRDWKGQRATEEDGDRQGQNSRGWKGQRASEEDGDRRGQNSRDWKGQRASEEDGDRRGQNSRDWKGQRASEEDGDIRGQNSRDWKWQRASEEDGDRRGQNSRDWKGQRASEGDGDRRGQNSRDWKGQRASEEDGDRRGQNSRDWKGQRASEEDSDRRGQRVPDEDRHNRKAQDRNSRDGRQDRNRDRDRKHDDGTKSSKNENSRDKKRRARS